MKKSIILTIVFAASSLFSFAQTEKKAATATPAIQLTKTELAGFTNVKDILSASDKSKDYSKLLVRNYSLTTTVTNPDKTTSVLSESGPGGIWGEKQKAMIEKYAKKGVTFNIEKVLIFEQVEKGVKQVDQSNISFSIKE